MSVENTTITPNSLPELTWNPLTWWKWWITPRQVERNKKFYERNTRALIVIIFGVFLSYLLSSISTGVLVGYELITGGAIGIFGIAIVATVRGFYRISSWILALVFLMLAFTGLYSSGYWAPNGVGMMLTILPVIILVLESDRAKIFFACLVPIIFTLTAFHQESTGFTSIFGENYSFSNPTGATIFFMVLMLILIGAGYYFIAEFRAQQAELRDLINTLEQRVADRTDELHKAKDLAEQANQTKSQFLANMSHELRTPLNAILNFSAFVADGVMGPVNPDQEDMLRQSISSGNHLLALINDVLDITKIEAGLMDLFIQPVDMIETLHAVESVGKGLVKNKDITLDVDIADDLPITYGDKRRLRQVFLNVLSNAIKFTPEGCVSIRAKASATTICVEIRDTGIGIAPQDQAMVFESFKQAKHDSIPEAIGTGLGMPISKHFVESHKGKIWLESEVGKGTTFFVELPVLTEAEADQITMNIEEQI